MTGQAVGYIEAIGLPAAIAAADAGVKAANVHLVGYELAKGGGLVTVKFRGDVAAVRSAVEAGSAEARRVKGVWATHVIARPADNIEIFVPGAQTEEEIPEELPQGQGLKLQPQPEPPSELKPKVQAYKEKNKQ